LTVEEFKELNETFSMEIGIVNRLEIAIQRWFHKRKLDPESRACIEAFLRFGGVNTSPKPFARLDRANEDELDVPDKKAALSTYHIMPDKFDEDIWSIGFLTIVQGFLASYFPNHFLQASKDPEKLVKKSCDIIVNFYNYLIYHRVCPEDEYLKDIYSAKALVIEKAPAQLLAVIEVPHVLPGMWSRAVTRIWDFSWDEKSEHPYVHKNDDEIGKFTIPEAMEIVAKGEKNCPFMTLTEFKKQYFLTQPDCWHKRVRTLFQGYGGIEIVELNPGKDNDDKKIVSVGVAICRPWYQLSNEVFDVPAGEEYLPQYLGHLKPKMEVWIDNIGLKKLSPGMKLRGRLYHMWWNGLGEMWVLSGKVQAYCSFYTITFNDFDAKKALRAPHVENILTHDLEEMKNHPVASKNWSDWGIADEPYNA
jgi:hypothetical protein